MKTFPWRVELLRGQVRKSGKTSNFLLINSSARLTEIQLQNTFIVFCACAATSVWSYTGVHTWISWISDWSVAASKQGWGLLSQFSPFRYFPHFPLLSQQTLAIEYHVYIWQVSPQPSCGDTCEIWMWFRESNRYFCKIENFAYGEISERSFSNPHPWPPSSPVAAFNMAARRRTRMHRDDVIA